MKNTVLRPLLCMTAAFTVVACNGTDAELESETQSEPAVDVRADTPPQETVRGEEIPLIEQLRAASVLPIDHDTPVELTDGSGEYRFAPGASGVGRFTILADHSATWQAQGRTDLAAIAVVDAGGSGTFHYLALYDVEDDSFVRKNQVLLGDRIRVKHVGIGELVHSPTANYRVTVIYMDRFEDEPMASEPTMEVKRVFYVTDQTFEEVEVLDSEP